MQPVEVRAMFSSQVPFGIWITVEEEMAVVASVEASSRWEIPRGEAEMVRRIEANTPAMGKKRILLVLG